MSNPPPVGATEKFDTYSAQYIGPGVAESLELFAAGANTSRQDGSVASFLLIWGSMMTPKYSRGIVSARGAAEPTPLIGAVLGLLAAVGIAVFFTGLPPAQTMGAGAVLLLVFAFKGIVSAWETGTGAMTAVDMPVDRKVAAKETMSEILDELGDNYLIMHDVRCRFGNIDHIVLSEDYGVFLIEREADFEFGKPRSERFCRTCAPALELAR